MGWLVYKFANPLYYLYFFLCNVFIGCNCWDHLFQEIETDSHERFIRLNNSSFVSNAFNLDIGNIYNFIEIIKNDPAS
jgi:hypothetical protein